MLHVLATHISLCHIASNDRAMASSGGGQGEQAAGLSKEASEELQKRVAFNELVSKLTDACFDKCVKLRSSLSQSETQCLAFCSLRYLESSQLTASRLQQSASSSSSSSS